MKVFRYGDIELLYHSKYEAHLHETFLYDVYNSNLINKGDIVVDIGAASGDFCFLASQKTGSKGKVVAIEPNPEDYNILIKNIQNSKIQNIIPINIGVSGKEGIETITFKESTFSFKTNTLKAILEDVNISSFDFVKLDIEGYEYEVIQNDKELFYNSRVISMEFHNNKEKIDSIILNKEFEYYTIPASYLIRKLFKNGITHPLLLSRAIFLLIRNNPSTLYKVIKGYDVTENKYGNYTGYYIKRR
jgi:FkbM family methyltransferase